VSQQLRVLRDSGFTSARAASIRSMPAGCAKSTTGSTNSGHSGGHVSMRSPPKSRGANENADNKIDDVWRWSVRLPPLVDFDGVAPGDARCGGRTTNIKASRYDNQERYRYSSRRSIVDVDDLCFGDPRYVVALTLASLTAFGGPTHYVDAWMTAAGYQDDRIFRLYVALFIVDFMSEHGQAFNDNPVPSSLDDRNRLLRVFAECLHLAER
jgi:hypothetical protein